MERDQRAVGPAVAQVQPSVKVIPRRGVCAEAIFGALHILAAILGLGLDARIDEPAPIIPGPAVKSPSVVGQIVGNQVAANMSRSLTTVHNRSLPGK